MKATVLNIKEVEGFKDFKKWEVTLKDAKGQFVAYRFHKELPGFEIGDTIEFTLKDNGSMVNVSIEGQEDKRQLMIVRQSCLKVASDYLHSRKDHEITEDFNPEDICDLAEYFTNYVINGNEKNPHADS